MKGITAECPDQEPYKIDRLTRSLADFARIVERFDARGVSSSSV